MAPTQTWPLSRDSSQSYRVNKLIRFYVLKSECDGNHQLVKADGRHMCIWKEDCEFGRRLFSASSLWCLFLPIRIRWPRNLEYLAQIYFHIRRGRIEAATLSDGNLNVRSWLLNNSAKLRCIVQLINSENLWYLMASFKREGAATAPLAREREDVEDKDTLSPSPSAMPARKLFSSFETGVS